MLPKMTRDPPEPLRAGRHYRQTGHESGRLTHQSPSLPLASYKGRREQRLGNKLSAGAHLGWMITPRFGNLYV